MGDSVGKEKGKEKREGKEDAARFPFVSMVDNETNGRNHIQAILAGVPMPTVLRSGPYRFYFYSHEPNEPPHVHVDRDDLSGKFWLQPVGLARNLGFSPKELRRLQKLVNQHQAEFLEAWHGHLGADG